MEAFGTSTTFVCEVSVRILSLVSVVFINIVSKCSEEKGTYHRCKSIFLVLFLQQQKYIS